MRPLHGECPANAKNFVDFVDNFQQKLQFARRCVHKRLCNTVAKNTQDFRRKFISSAAISNIRFRVRSKMTDCATGAARPFALSPKQINRAIRPSTKRDGAKRQYIPLPRMFGKRRQRKRMARPRADDRNRISARTARSSQTPYQRYIAPRQPRSAGGKQNAAKYRFSAALCRLYARPATRQIGANRKRYSARTLAFRNFR